MGGEGIIAAAVGALAGGGGVRALGRFIGPQHRADVAEYYREVIEGLVEENRELRAELAGIRRRITDLELAQDDPPPHLG
ncbi:MAG TPA: hypothetical protein VFI17_03575 [Solirubrobacterales bacterium]|nr:hypothetical protein [Solirubrobacterales bacterium]